jgi:hypothetical protein
MPLLRCICSSFVLVNRQHFPAINDRNKSASHSQIRHTGVSSRVRRQGQEERVSGGGAVVTVPHHCVDVFMLPLLSQARPLLSGGCEVNVHKASMLGTLLRGLSVVAINSSWVIKSERDHPLKLIMV